MEFIKLTKSDGSSHLINLNQVEKFLGLNDSDGDRSLVIFGNADADCEAYQENLTEIENLIKKS
jgi:hypothetical protein